MTSKEIVANMFLGQAIQHEKGGIYHMKSLGQMKTNGEWVECISYQDINTGDIYTRSTDNFNKFTIKG
jgi:hypothetical protein